MGRLVNGERKITNPRPENVGQLLVFCEGSTEYNYLDYFKMYLEYNRQNSYSDIVLECVNAKGNAMRVYEVAEAYLSDDEKRSKYQNYEKHLVFDCDAPEDIQTVVDLMGNSSNEYILDYTNLLFETWLVMHYQNIWPGEECEKRNVIRCMREHLGVERYTSKVKADKGTIGKILGSNGNPRIRAAIENAKNLERYWKENGISMHQNIKVMNPSAPIYGLVERVLDEIEYSC